MLRQTDTGQARALSAGKGSEFGVIREQDVCSCSRKKSAQIPGGLIMEAFECLVKIVCPYLCKQWGTIESEKDARRQHQR